MLEVASGQTVGFVRDLSQHGALVFTRRPVGLGASLVVSMYSEGTRRPVKAVGRVVRSARRERGVQYPWTYSVAVEFEQPMNAGDARGIASRSGGLVGPP